MPTEEDFYEARKGGALSNCIELLLYIEKNPRTKGAWANGRHAAGGFTIEDH